MSNTNPRRNAGELIGKNILCRRSLRPHLNEFRFFGTATKPPLQNFGLNSTCSLEPSFNWKLIVLCCARQSVGGRTGWTMVVVVCVMSRQWYRSVFSVAAQAGQSCRYCHAQTCTEISQLQASLTALSSSTPSLLLSSQYSLVSASLVSIKRAAKCLSLWTYICSFDT